VSIETNPKLGAVDDDGSPGSHLRNWRPGDDDSEELLLQKLRDALRDGKSERQIAKLLDVPRSMLWRAKKFNAIPKGLLERLLAARVDAKAMIYIGRCCENGSDEFPPVEVECCPNCGHLLRARDGGIRRAFGILKKWVEDGEPSAAEGEP
jgi:hypothetical protein